MEKEIWTIDDILKDYEDKGLTGRSKVDFLNNLKDFILKNTRYVQWSSVSVEEHEKLIEEIKQKIEEKMKNKDFGIVDYTNPGPINNLIYIPKPKKYLKWEDLKFEDGKSHKVKVSLNGNNYTVVSILEKKVYENTLRSGIMFEVTGTFYYERVVILSENNWTVYDIQAAKDTMDELTKDRITFFNNLNLEVIE